jgi:transposase
LNKVMDILPDRTSETLAHWLQVHPGVEIVSRDRAGAYAEGIRVGAPDAIQVADRWHLLKNLTDTVYKVLQQHHAATEQAFRPTAGPAVSQEKSPIPDSVSPDIALTHQPTAADSARHQRVQEAHRLHKQGWSTKDIAQHLGVCTKTVRRHLNQSLTLVPLRRSGRMRLIDPYRPYLLERWNAGCHNASQLCREIQTHGYAGQLTMVCEFICYLRQASGLPPRVRRLTGEPVKIDPSVRPPTVRALAHLVVRPPDKLDAVEQKYLAKLAAVHPKLKVVMDLAQEFATMVRQRQPEQLAAWLEKSHITPLRSFATGLQHDIAAVQAGLSLPWSNGATEGHINLQKF